MFRQEVASCKIDLIFFLVTNTKQDTNFGLTSGKTSL